MTIFCCQQTRVVSEKVEAVPTDLVRVAMRDQVISQIGMDTGLEILDIGDFSKGELLGSGTSSKVHLFVRNSDGQKFAGKLLKCEVGSREYINEAKIMNSCSRNCANIVNMIGITTTPNCILMDYHANGSLDVALLEDNKNVNNGLETEFPFLRRLSFILDMCKAVTALHFRNVCHRDIAMRNLLLSDDKKRVLLTDFSLSRVVSSAIETQSTLTNFLPKESAPETIGTRSSSTTGRRNYERHYSMKSDVWNLGITMWGIIEKNVSLGTKWQQPPSRLPTKCLPHKNIFNRKDDLWRAMLRCWHIRPELRPQSWELQQQVRNLLENPLCYDNDNEGYITYLSTPGTANLESTYDDQLFANSYSQSTMDCYRQNVNISELQCSNTNLKVNSAPSSLFSEQESAYSLKKITEPGVSCFKGRDIKMLGPNLGEDTSPKKEKHEILLSKLNDEYISDCLTPLVPNISSFFKSGSIIMGNRSCKKLRVAGNKSGKVTPKSYLGVNWGMKFFKRLGSLTSVINSSLTSVTNTSTSCVEDSEVCDRVEYCSPLDVSFRSSATNIAYCGDRHFFGSSCMLIEPGKVDSSEYLVSPKLQSVKENSLSSTHITCDVAPRFNISVK